MRSRPIPADFERYISADGTRASLGYRNLTTLPTWISCSDQWMMNAGGHAAR